ncbi:MAG: hypothetical protein D3X82_13955 [Candidatus Leucobacter sulfamidivorax]|nr:hypothetical protein [Candidatus Leucobacter sulfamidivorax]
MKTIDAGSALLGAVVGTNGAVLDEVSVLADDFSEPWQGKVWEASLKLRRDGKPVDVVTLAENLPEHYGGDVMKLLEWTHLTYGAAEYASIVEHHGTRRRLAEAAAAIAALDPGLSSSEMVDRAQAILGAVAERSVKPRYRFVGDMLDEVLVAVSESATFVPSPWQVLDRAIGGFRPGAVYVVAARPGVGKTVVAAQIATGLAEHGAVAFSSLEMSGPELVQRFISERALVSVRNLKNNKLTDRDYGLIRDRRDVLMGLNIAIDDRTSIAPSDVRGFARSLSRTHHLAGVVVDYLQLMSAPSKEKRYEQVTEFSRQMKVLAKDFNVPVIVLSQLNRQSESRTDGRPKLSDLRESGAIEQDADVVLLLRREGEQPNEQLIIDVAKNRHGETGEVELDWQGYYSRAVES